MTLAPTATDALAMTAPSLAQALAHARYTFRSLAVRAWDAAPAEERGYVASLAMEWDNRLGEMDPGPAPISEDALKVLDHLTATVVDGRLTPTALAEWVDAFPSAVTDLIATTGVTLSDDFLTGVDWTDVPQESASEPEATAANKQSTLALAA